MFYFNNDWRTPLTFPDGLVIGSNDSYEIRKIEYKFNRI